MKINRILQVLIILVLPFLFLMSAVRVLITPGYAAFEYQRSWFPKDPYGLSKDERLVWSRYAINYLTNDEDISYLGDLRFEDDKEVFNARELEHMIDVKKVVKTSLTVWYALLGFTFAVLMWFVIMGAWKPLRQGLIGGAWLTVSLIVALIIFIAVSFNNLFDRFHQLFFKDGTWLFYESDTLIRLFPLTFWRDAFILVSVLTLLFAGLLLIIFGVISKVRKNKQKKSLATP